MYTSDIRSADKAAKAAKAAGIFAAEIRTMWLSDDDQTPNLRTRKDNALRIAAASYAAAKDEMGQMHGQIMDLLKTSNRKETPTNEALII